ncbi:hypothetical protein AAKU67_003490 [Oxalobacteraceae bacterium GrIS 2.11]
MQSYSGKANFLEIKLDVSKIFSQPKSLPLIFFASILPYLKPLILLSIQRPCAQQ